MAEKPKSEKKKEGKEEERIMTIPLRHTADKSAKNKRMNRSVREIKHFLSRHMKVEASMVSISQQLNESVWKSGFHKPPASIKVKVSKDDEGKVHAQLIDEKEKPKKERKSRLGLRERLRRKASETPSGEESARRKEESAKEEKDSGKKPELKTEGGTEAGRRQETPSIGSSPSNERSASKSEEKKPEHKKEPKEIEQDILLEK